MRVSRGCVGFLVRPTWEGDGFSFIRICVGDFDVFVPSLGNTTPIQGAAWARIRTGARFFHTGPGDQP